MPLLPLLGDPNANRSLIQWVDWAGLRPEGRISESERIDSWHDRELAFQRLVQRLLDLEGFSDA